MGRAVRVAILVSFGYLVVVAVGLDAFVQSVDASYFVVFQQAVHFPFVCTCPCADFDEPEERESKIDKPIAIQAIKCKWTALTYVDLALSMCHVMRYCHLSIHVMSHLFEWR